MDLGKIFFSLALNNRDFRKGIQDSTMEVEDMVASTEAASNRMDSAFGRVGRAATAMKQRLQGVSTSFKSFGSGSGGPTNPLDGMSAKMKKFNTILDEAKEKLHSYGSQWKDVGRIVQGILISQAFYKGLNALQSATGVIRDFQSELEVALVTYTRLLGDEKLANQFVRQLEGFAAVTPFDFPTIEEAARKMLAMGFAAEDVIPVMTDLADAAAAAGNPEVFGRVALALGQIKTKGRLAGQELLQLTEAGIPAFEILKEELQLTSKQVANIADAGISADTAIEALRVGIKKRFGGLGNEIAETAKGMRSTISDNMKSIGSDVFASWFDAYKGALRSVRDASNQLADMGRAGGLGAIFEGIFPPAVQTDLRLLAAQIILLGEGLKQLAVAGGSIAHGMGDAFRTTLALILPGFTAFVTLVAKLLTVAQNSTGALHVLGQAIGMLLVAELATKSLILLRGTIMSLSVVKGIAAGFNALSKSVALLSAVIATSPMVGGLLILSGVLVYTALKSKQAKVSLTDLGNSISKTFGVDPTKIFKPKVDEVAASAGSAADNLGDAAANTKELGKEAEKAGKKAKSLLLAFDEVFTLPDDAAEDAANAIDDYAGALNTIPEFKFPSFGIDTSQLPSITTAVDDWWTEFLNGWKLITSGSSWSDLIDAYIVHPWKMAWADLGNELTYTGLRMSTYAEKQITDFKNWTSTTATDIGNWVSDTSKALGGWVSSSGKGISDWFTNSITGIGSWGTTTAGNVVTWATDTGSSIGNWIADAGAKLTNWAVTSAQGFGTWATDAGNSFSTWVSNSASGVTGWLSNTGKGLTQWAKDSAADFVTWQTSGEGSFTTWATNTAGKVSTWASETATSLETWFTDSTSKLLAWGTNSDNNFTNWYTTSSGNFNEWNLETTKSIQDWYTNTKKSITTWSTETLKAFETWRTDTASGFTTWWKTSEQGFATWAGNAYTNVIGKFLEMYERIKEIFKDIVNAKDETLKVLEGVTVSFNAIPFVPDLPMPKIKTGHATGGIFDREHVATLNEGNKMEAILPVENPAAMAQVRRAIFGGDPKDFFQSLIPATSVASGPAPTPMYVGTLIADDRGLRELDRRMQVIRVGEQERRGE